MLRRSTRLPLTKKAHLLAIAANVAPAEFREGDVIGDEAVGAIEEIAFREIKRLSSPASLAGAEEVCYSGRA